ncbi:alanine racemase [Terriglobus sp.]|uniref:alanine racemase n=1 Tax=Terriglobus sp. TaxID=1889013 RepID=UPI003B0019E6
MRPVAVQHTRPVWAEVSSAALCANYRRLCAAAGPDVDVLAVVKANAYGHGAAECAPVLARAGARWFGVTAAEEGVTVRAALRAAGVKDAARILIMCGVWQHEAAFCFDHALTPVVWEPYQLALLEQEAMHRHWPHGVFAVHVEIDTGMARQGVAPGAALAALLSALRASPHLRLEALLTHFASAEVVDDPQNREQQQRFEVAVEQTHAAGFRPDLLHAGNTSGVDSAATAAWLPGLQASLGSTSGSAPQLMTRAGLALYGYTLPLHGFPERGAAEPASHLPGMEPALVWKTRIVSLRTLARGETVGYNATYVAARPMRVALLPVGYADGFRRALSSTNAVEGSTVLIHGRRAPIVGRVSMDLSVVDVSAVPEAAVGDAVTLLGRDGALSISAAEHARLAGTNVYEILCGISDRVPRLIV